MILASMSLLQMHKALVDNKNKVQYRIDKILPKVISNFKKSRNFPVWYLDEYTIPSTNDKFVVFIYVGNRFELEHPHYSSFFIVYDGNNRFVMSGMSMGYKHTTKSEMIMLPQIHIYTSHFFQRYNERYLHNNKLSANEVAGMYFIRNRKIIPIELNEDINRNYKEYGDLNGQGFRVYDGFCFGETAIDGKFNKDGDRNKDVVEAMIIKFKTFLSKEDLSEAQSVAIDKEHIKTISRCFDNFEMSFGE